MIKMKKKTFVLTLIGTALAVLLIAGGGFYLFAKAGNFQIVGSEDYQVLQDMSEKYGKLYTMQNTINEKFLWKTDEESQMDAMYKALLDSLGDEYSVYMTKEEAEEWNRSVTGVFTGVGITFHENEDGEFEISDVMAGGPADTEGLKKGDLILKIDDETYDSIEEAASALRGETGTRVKVTYERSGKVRTAQIVRGEVEESSVYSAVLDEEYGYIRITSFESSTADQFHKQLSVFENKNVKGVIIDLRDNLGGILDQSIEVADLLLPECTIIHTEDRVGEKEYYNSDESCTRLPYVLLVNENTASAAEILASAVKENEGGKLVGTKTFGKGIIQTSIQFSDQSAIRLTTMQYLSAQNHQIHEKGVKPDYEVKQPENSKTDRQLEKAVELLK